MHAIGFTFCASVLKQLPARPFILTIQNPKGMIFYIESFAIFLKFNVLLDNSYR